MIRVAVLGSSGMLGWVLAHELRGFSRQLVEFNRSAKPSHRGNEVVRFEAELPYENLEALLKKNRIEIVVNAVGVIRQKIVDSSPESVERAFVANSFLPAKLEIFSIKNSVPVIQIGTDCVFLGEKGSYTELDTFDAKDIYGLSKIVGELSSKTAKILRCSIVGSERNSSFSLMSWALSQKKNATIRGFNNHYWNGLTSLAFSRIVSALIETEISVRVCHLVPRDFVTKLELLGIILRHSGRSDINLIEYESEDRVDRRLATLHPDINKSLWNRAGYSSVPKIEDLILEFFDWEKCRKRKGIQS